MTVQERYEDARAVWNEGLAPQTRLEQRLVKFISCQDWLLQRSMMRAMSSDDEYDTIVYEQRQHELIRSIGCLVDAIAALRQSAQPDPKQPAKANKAKIVEMPKRSESTAFGKAQPEPLPGVQPIFPAHSGANDRKPRSRSLSFHREAA